MKGLGEDAQILPEETSGMGRGRLGQRTRRSKMCASPSPSPSLVNKALSIERPMPNKRNSQGGPKLSVVG